MGTYEQPEFDPFAIPAPFVRDANNKAPFMSNVSEDEAPKAKAKSAPSKVKANGVDKTPPKTSKVKTASGKAKAETAPKAKAKASKGSEKPKAAKPKAEAVEKDAFGFRKGSAKSKAVAMYAAKKGATLEEVKEAVGSIQLNVLNALEEDGYKVERKKEERDGARSVTRYFLKGK